MSPDFIKEFTILPSLTNFIVLVILFTTVIRQGFGKTLGIIALLITVGLPLLALVFGSTSYFIAIISLIVTLALGLTSSVVLTGTIATLQIAVGKLGMFIAGLSYVGTVLLALYATMAKGSYTIAASSIATAIIFLFLSIHTAIRALSEDEKFSFIRSLAIVFSSIGGTSFRHADLTDANFTRTKLKGTDFRNAYLNRVFWLEAVGINLARVRAFNTF